VTIIYTSHYMEEVEYLCRRVAIIDHGRVIAQGYTDEVRALAGDSVVLRVPLLTPEAQSVDVDGLRRAVGVPLEARSSELRFMLPEGSSQVPGILNVLDRKSTRLNSSHVKISYAVFCLKKKSVRQGEG